MKARVLRAFRGNPTGYGSTHDYEMGREFILPHPLVPPRVQDAWVNAGFIELVDAKAKPGPPSNKMRASPANKIEHVGGGWYELPNGERVRGKDAALEALESS